MTEAGQLEMDQAIWHAGKVWWVATIGSTGDVTFVDEPQPGGGQVSQLVLERNDEVVTASEALMDARGRLDCAVARLRRRHRSPMDFEIAAGEERKAMRDIEALNAAGIIAGFEL